MSLKTVKLNVQNFLCEGRELTWNYELKAELHTCLCEFQTQLASVVDLSTARPYAVKCCSTVARVQHEQSVVTITAASSQTFSMLHFIGKQYSMCLLSVLKMCWKLHTGHFFSEKIRRTSAWVGQMSELLQCFRRSLALQVSTLEPFSQWERVSRSKRHYVLAVVLLWCTLWPGSVRADSVAASRLEQTLSEVASSLGSGGMQPRLATQPTWALHTQIWLQLGVSLSFTFSHSPSSLCFLYFLCLRSVSQTTVCMSVYFCVIYLLCLFVS